MKLPKKIIDEFVSWIDPNDIKRYIRQLEMNTIGSYIVNNLPITIRIIRNNKINYIYKRKEIKNGKQICKIKWKEKN